MDEVDVLIDRVRVESSRGAPILMQLYLSDDLYRQEFGVGINGERGVLSYSGRDWFEPVYSIGDGPAGGMPLLYYYMGNDTEFPSDSEISLDTVREVVKEFLATNGARPECVQWRADR